jgi:hypothetical protein
MTDIQLYTKLSLLPLNLKKEAEDFIDFLKQKAKKEPSAVHIRKAGLAKDLIRMKDNFEEPIEGFEPYI